MSLQDMSLGFGALLDGAHSAAGSDFYSRSRPQDRKPKGVAMSHTAMRRSRSLAKFRGASAWEFRAIFAITFAVLLGAAIVERLLPFRSWANEGAARSKQTVFEQARAGANTCAAYAFMG